MTKANSDLDCGCDAPLAYHDLSGIARLTATSDQQSIAIEVDEHEE